MNAQAVTLDPEKFANVSSPPTSPGTETFENLRNRIAELEQQGTARDGAEVPAAPVTAAVTPRPKRRPATGKEQPKMQSTATVGASNAPTFASILATATDLGAQAGLGKDTQIKFDLKVLEGAYLGTLDLDPNKHGTDRRDGVVLGEAYMQAFNKSVIFDVKSPAGRKLVSNVDKCIKAGSCPKWGQGQPLQIVNELVTLRQQLRRDPANAKKIEDAHNMLMRFLTNILKNDTLPTTDQLREFVFKRDPNSRSAEEILEGIRKVANNLKAGKVSNCPDLDNSAEVQAIIAACTKRLTAIAKARGQAAGAHSTGAAA